MYLSNWSRPSHFNLRTHVISIFGLAQMLKVYLLILLSSVVHTLIEKIESLRFSFWLTSSQTFKRLIIFWGGGWFPRPSQTHHNRSESLKLCRQSQREYSRQCSSRCCVVRIFILEHFQVISIQPCLSLPDFPRAAGVVQESSISASHFCSLSLFSVACCSTSMHIRGERSQRRELLTMAVVAPPAGST